MAVVAAAACVGIVLTDSSDADDSGKCGSNLSWEYTENDHTLTFSGSGVMNDYELSKAPWYGYSGEIREVVLCEGIRNIGAAAFLNLCKVNSVIIPTTVETIGTGAFCGCSSLVSVTMPDSIISIGSYAFDECSSLVSAVIPDSVKTIGDHAFHKCGSLTEVTISDSVKTIGDHAFYKCSSLTEVTIPNSVETIGDGAFEDCPIAKVYNCSKLNVKGQYGLSGDAVLIIDKCGDNLVWEFNENDGTLTIKGTGAMYNYFRDGTPWNCMFFSTISTEVTKVVLPDGLTRIGEYAFSQFSLITSISVPATVESIGKGAFYDCSRLKTVTICGPVKSIGEDVFSEDYVIETVHNYSKYDLRPYLKEDVVIVSHWCGDDLVWDYSEDGRKLTVTGSGAMYPVGSAGTWHMYDKDIVSVELPEGLTSIGVVAFAGMTSLKSVTIPATVKSIGMAAFSMCSSLTSVYIPDSVRSIDVLAFSGCSSLTSLTIPGSVEWIGVEAFGKSSISELYNYSDVDILSGGYGLSADAAVFDEKCGDDLFWKYAEDDRTLVISGFGAMYDFGQGEAPWSGCGKVVSISLCDGLTGIGSYAFCGFDSLMSVTLPETVETIGEGAFRDCSALVAVIIYGPVETIGEGAFDNCGSLEVIGNFSPFDLSEDRYGLPDNVPVYSGCGTDMLWNYSESDHMLTIIGSGEMYDYQAAGAPWYRYSEEVLCIALSSEITGIGSYAFCGFTSLSRIAKAVTPDAVDGAFSNLLPDSLETIGGHAFSGCALTDVTIPGSVTAIGEDAFEGSPIGTVYNLSEIDIAAGLYGLSDTADVVSGRCGSNLLWSYDENDHTLAVYGSGAMYDYDAGDAPWYGNKFSGTQYDIVSVLLPDGLTHIGDYAFYEFHALRSVEIPETVESIGTGAFCGCGLLDSLTAPGLLKTIGDWAFYRCALTEVTIPGCVAEIGDRAFEGCPIGTVINFSLLDIVPGQYGLAQEAYITKGGA